DAGVEHGDLRRAERVDRAVDLIPADLRQVPPVRAGRVVRTFALPVPVEGDAGDVRVRAERSENVPFGAGRNLDRVHREGGDGTDEGRACGGERGGLGRGARAVGEGDEVVRSGSAGSCDGGGGGGRRGRGRTCPTRGCEAERRDA